MEENDLAEGALILLNLIYMIVRIESSLLSGIIHNFFGDGK